MVGTIWNTLYAALDAINDHDVVFRYPGRAATKTEAREAQCLCRTIRGAERLSLGLPSD